MVAKCSIGIINEKEATDRKKGHEMEPTINENTQIEQEDSVADAVAAVALVLIFVAACIFWISGQ